jgi:uncharacterized protein (TIGR02266 family)
MILEEHQHKSDEVPQADSRQDLRVPITVLQADCTDGHKTFFGYAKNLSKGGMMIGTVNPREPGSRFWVEFPLPEPVNRVARCHCEVVWQRCYSREHRYDPGMGLRFLDLPDDMAEAIDAWVQEQERQRLLLS